MITKKNLCIVCILVLQVRVCIERFTLVIFRQLYIDIFHSMSFSDSHRSDSEDNFHKK